MSNTKILLGFIDVDEHGSFHDGDGNFGGMSVHATRVAVLKIDTPENIKEFLVQEKKNIEEARKIYRELDKVDEYSTMSEKAYDKKHDKAIKLDRLRKFNTLLMIDGEDLTYLIK